METFEEHYASMKETILKRMPGVDMALIDRAVEYADVKHQHQKRKDGSPYIIHPLAVAEIVCEMGLDIDAILGALLHDCIEDTDASHEEIEKLFSTTVAELVEGVTKLTRAAQLGRISSTFIWTLRSPRNSLIWGTKAISTRSPVHTEVLSGVAEK